MKIHNVHERRISAEPSAVGALLDRLACDDDPVWPKERWPAMKLDRALSVGARGGHGPVRYRVHEYRPGTRVCFVFEQSGLSRGIVGEHRFEVEEAEGEALIRHVIDAEAEGVAALQWRLFVEPLHDACVEDAFDNVERALTGRPDRLRRWPGKVRALHFVADRMFG